MSRRRKTRPSRPVEPSRPRAMPPGPVAPPHRRFPGPIWARVGLGLLAAVALVLFWVGRAPGVVSAPLPDLSQVDASVAATVRKFHEAVRSDPRSAAAWGHLGIVLREYGFKPEARQCLDQAERLEPTNPRWPYAHAILLLVHTPLEAAVKLRRAVELCGNDPEAPRYRLAKILAEAGRWSEAEVELEALRKGRPDFAPARLLSALGARAAGNFPEAIALARTCTEDPRTSHAAWALLATLYRQQGDAAAAENAIRRAGALPKDEGFGDPFEAEAILLRGDPRALTEHAHPLLAAGRLAEAARLIDRLVSEHAGYAETWLLVGRLRLLRKDLPAAEQALRRHLEMDPRSVQGWFQLGMSLLQQNRLLEAADGFLKATEIKPDHGPAYFNRGVALARAGQIPAAAEALRATLRHNPEHAETYVLLADLELQLGHKEQALELIERAQTLTPADRRLPGLRQRAAP